MTQTVLAQEDLIDQYIKRGAKLPRRSRLGSHPRILEERSPRGSKEAAVVVERGEVMEVKAVEAVEVEEVEEGVEEAEAGDESFN